MAASQGRACLSTPLCPPCLGLNWALGGHALCCWRVPAQLCPTLYNPMDCSRQGPLSMGFSRQEFWSGLPYPPPGVRPNPRIKPVGLLCWQAGSLPPSHLEVNSAGWSGHGGGRCEGQRQLAFRVQVRLTQPLSSRPFLDMVHHTLDSPDDDYHALFVLCLLYAMSHNKGKPLSSSAFREKDSCFPWRISFLVLADSHRTCL